MQKIHLIVIFIDNIIYYINLYSFEEKFDVCCIFDKCSK